jgi:hypothetical protein
MSTFKISDAEKQQACSREQASFALASALLLAGFSGSFAGSPIVSSGLIEVGNKSIVLDGRRLK